MFPCGLPLAILTHVLQTPDFERSAPKRRALAKNSNSLVGKGVRTAQNGSSQGRKPDDECHRLRRGREKFGTNFIVT